MQSEKRRVNLTIPGAPMGKQRPKVFNGHGVTPAKTVNYETLVKELYAVNKHPMLNGYISVHIVAYYEIPKSTSNKQRQRMLNMEVLPDKKPDLDNIAKIICDSLNGIAYSDDKQVICLTARKAYDEAPSVEVYLEEM
jgi:Holliday junction resolvase RusA-like endonuclease